MSFRYADRPHGRQGVRELPCIYPGPHGKMSSEHYLPAALGTFEGFQPLLDRVCKNCNNEIGRQVETQFLRAGPTGFFRWHLGIRGRDGLPPSPFRHGASGVPPMYMVGRAAGLPCDLLWEVIPGTGEIQPLRQVVLEHPLAGTHQLPITERMESDPKLFGVYVKERNLESARVTYVFIERDRAAWLRQMLEENGFSPPNEWTEPKFEPQTVDLVTTVTANDRYFRAIGKIAFHYALWLFPDLQGTEREFEQIRAFVWSGEGPKEIVRQRRDQFIINFDLNQVPASWCHILAVERGPNGIVAQAQFFTGPEVLPLPYEIRVGRDPARIRRPRERRAHVFRILNPTAASGPIGVMEELPVLQRIVPVRPLPAIKRRRQP